MATWRLSGLQDSVSPLMEEYSTFNDYGNMYLVIVFWFVAGGFAICAISGVVLLEEWDGEYLEVLWTSLPLIVVTQVGLPSLYLLFIMESTSSPDLIVKVLGHQWYWTYNYVQTPAWGGSEFVFDAYLEKSGESKDVLVRSLDTDNRVVLPGDSMVHALVLSTDVLHSWTLPSLGVKIDACPGRVNDAEVYFFRPGVFFGQCSEICGANHSFMPIAVESVNVKDFCLWLFGEGDFLEK